MRHEAAPGRHHAPRSKAESANAEWEWEPEAHEAGGVRGERGRRRRRPPPRGRGREFFSFFYYASLKSPIARSEHLLEPHELRLSELQDRAQ